jgi:tRNA (guanosine-2'-O-)-methyltransferase
MSRTLGGTELKRLHRDWRRRTGGRLGLLLDGVQNPFNVGAILRTAAAFTVDHLWLVGAPSPSDAKVQKTALGSQRFCTWTFHDTSTEALAAARADGYQVVGVELAEGAAPLHELDLSGDVCLAVGHEDRGLSKDLLGGCDAVGFIPQLGRIGSLNVSTATAIACYEVRRTAWTGSGRASTGPPG